MTENHQLVQQQATSGDAAVDGLFAGMGAGVLMAAYLVLAGLLISEGPGTMLGRFAVGEATSPLAGSLSHLAVAGMYGVLFAMGWRPISRRVEAPTWLGGLVYAAALLIAAEVLVLPVSDSTLGQIPLVHFAIAHGVYGVVLGWLLGRRREA
ncbi:MAG: hypothetical protein P8Y03_07970 [Anaerolineales bacterium]|jgi:hypothetical protein